MSGALSISRFDIWLVQLDPTVGSEIRKTRPAIVVSPIEMNRRLNTVVVLPMTTTRKNWPSRINIEFEGKSGQAAVDQIRAIDKIRLVKRLGKLPREKAEDIRSTLMRMFAR